MPVQSWPDPSVSYWLAFRCRPSGRTVVSRFVTVCLTQSSPPKGRRLSMLTRTRSSSFAVKGVFTRAVQLAGRSMGQGDNDASIACSPCILDQRLPHRHSCARSTRPADKGFRST